MTQVNLGASLRLIRIFHDKNVTETAKLLEVTPAHISSLEYGRKVPNLEMLAKYARVFDTTKARVLQFSERVAQVKEKDHIKRMRALMPIFLETL